MELWLWVISGLLWAGSATLVVFGVRKYLKARRKMHTQLLSTLANRSREAATGLLNILIDKTKTDLILTKKQVDEDTKICKQLLDDTKRLYTESGIEEGSTGELEGIEANKEVVLAAIFFAGSSFLIGLSSVLIVVFR